MDNKQERFWEILEPEYVGAMMFCRKLMADRDKGDDLYQDALINAFTNFADIRDENSFRPWLYKIIINTFKSKNRLKFPRLFKSIKKESDLNLKSIDPTDEYTSKRWLNKSFEILSSNERTLITLYELEEWNIRELSELYNKSEASIKQGLFRIRNKMKKYLIGNLTESKSKSIDSFNIKKDNRCAVVKPDSE